MLVSFYSQFITRRQVSQIFLSVFYNDFPWLKAVSALNGAFALDTYIIKMKTLKSCADPQDKNSLVTLFHAEISKPLVLDDKDCNHHFANEQMRPKYRTCLRKQGLSVRWAEAVHLSVCVILRDFCVSIVLSEIFIGVILLYLLRLSITYLKIVSAL